MRMHLKNRKLKLKRVGLIKNIKFNSKNLIIFLVSFAIISLILGIIFFLILNNADKLSSLNTNYFETKEYDYIVLFRNNFLENTFNFFLIWVLGLSIIGIIFILVIYFFHFFTVGFSIASIFSKYGIKGILGTLLYLFPSKIIYLIVLFFLSFFAIKISYKFLKLCFGKEEITIKKEMNIYFKVIVFGFIMSLLITLLEIFIDPFFLKLF